MRANGFNSRILFFYVLAIRGEVLLKISLFNFLKLVKYSISKFLIQSYGICRSFLFQLSQNPFTDSHHLLNSIVNPKLFLYF